MQKFLSHKTVLTDYKSCNCKLQSKQGPSASLLVVEPLSWQVTRVSSYHPEYEDNTASANDERDKDGSHGICKSLDACFLGHSVTHARCNTVDNGLSIVCFGDDDCGGRTCVVRASIDCVANLLADWAGFSGQGCFVE